MESKEQHEWVQKRMFIVTSALFLVYWMMYFVHLAKTWASVDPRMRVDSSSLATFSIALWIFLLKERVSGWAMAWACFTFVAAANLVLHIF